MTLFRFFSAFYVANDERAFLSLFGSMALSCWGTSTGLFISNHLAIVDLEDEDDLMLGSVKRVVLDPFSSRCICITIFRFILLEPFPAIESMENLRKEAEIGTMGPLPSPQVLGQSIQTPHQQHGPFGRNVFPPPPGLYAKPPGVYPPGLYPKKRVNLHQTQND